MSLYTQQRVSGGPESTIIERYETSLYSENANAAGIHSQKKLPPQDVTPTPQRTFLSYRDFSPAQHQLQVQPQPARYPPARPPPPTPPAAANAVPANAAPAPANPNNKDERKGESTSTARILSTPPKPLAHPAAGKQPEPLPSTLLLVLASPSPSASTTQHVRTLFARQPYTHVALLAANDAACKALKTELLSAAGRLQRNVRVEARSVELGHAAGLRERLEEVARGAGVRGVFVDLDAGGAREVEEGRAERGMGEAKEVDLLSVSGGEMERAWRNSTLLLHTLAALTLPSLLVSLTTLPSSSADDPFAIDSPTLGRASTLPPSRPRPALASDSPFFVLAPYAGTSVVSSPPAPRSQNPFQTSVQPTAPAQTHSRSNPWSPAYLRPLTASTQKSAPPTPTSTSVPAPAPSSLPSPCRSRALAALTKAGVEALMAQLALSYAPLGVRVGWSEEVVGVGVGGGAVDRSRSQSQPQSRHLEQQQHQHQRQRQTLDRDGDTKSSRTSSADFDDLADSTLEADAATMTATATAPASTAPPTAAERAAARQSNTNATTNATSNAAGMGTTPTALASNGTTSPSASEYYDGVEEKAKAVSVASGSVSSAAGAGGGAGVVAGAGTGTAMGGAGVAQTEEDEMDDPERLWGLWAQHEEFLS